MTQVTGILTDEVGTVLANTTCAVVAIDQVVGQDGGGRVSRGSIVVTDGAGEFDADIKPGRYELVVEVSAPADANVKFSRIGRLTVLTTGPMTLEEALDKTVGEITPNILQQAIDAKDAAEAAAVISTTQAGIATTAADRSEVARDDAQGVLPDRLRRDVPTLLADTALTYTADQPGTVTAGDIIRTRSEGLSVEVVASGGMRQTSGGVHLRTRDKIVPEFWGITPGQDVTAGLVALGAWIDGSAARGRDALMQLREGTYTVDVDQESFRARNRSTIAGAGRGATVLKAADGADANGVSQIVRLPVGDMTLRDLTIDGNWQNADMSGGIGANAELVNADGDNITAENLELRNAISEAWDCDQGSNHRLAGLRVIDALGSSIRYSRATDPRGMINNYIADAYIRCPTVEEYADPAGRNGQVVLRCGDMTIGHLEVENGRDTNQPLANGGNINFFEADGEFKIGTFVSRDSYAPAVTNNNCTPQTNIDFGLLRVEAPREGQRAIIVSFGPADHVTYRQVEIASAVDYDDTGAVFLFNRGAVTTYGGGFIRLTGQVDRPVFLRSTGAAGPNSTTLRLTGLHLTAQQVSGWLIDGLETRIEIDGCTIDAGEDGDAVIIRRDDCRIVNSTVIGKIEIAPFILGSVIQGCTLSQAPVIGAGADQSLIIGNSITPFPQLRADFADGVYSAVESEEVVPKTFGDLFTFTRTGAATYFDASGDPQSAAENTPRFTHDPITLEPQGILREEARTKILGAAGSIAVTEQPYAISFYGDGEVTLTGAHSATVVGNADRSRTVLVFTPSAGTLTVATSGEVLFLQLEAGQYATSFINGSAPVTRNEEILTLDSAEWYDTPLTVHIEGLLSYANRNNGDDVEFFSMADSGQFFRAQLTTAGGRTGSVRVQSNAGTTVTAEQPTPRTEYEPGLNVAFDVLATLDDENIIGRQSDVPKFAAAIGAVPAISGQDMLIGRRFNGNGSLRIRSLKIYNALV